MSTLSDDIPDSFAIFISESNSTHNIGHEPANAELAKITNTIDKIVFFILNLSWPVKWILSRQLLDQIDKMDPDLLNDYNKLEFFIRVLNDDVEDLKEYVANELHTGGPSSDVKQSLQNGSDRPVLA